MEMREPLVRSLKTWTDFAVEENLIDIFKMDRRFGLMTLPLAIWTVGSDMVCTMWDQCGR